MNKTDDTIGLVQLLVIAMHNYIRNTQITHPESIYKLGLTRYSVVSKLGVAAI